MESPSYKLNVQGRSLLKAFKNELQKPAIKQYFEFKDYSPRGMLDSGNLTQTGLIVHYLWLIDEDYGGEITYDEFEDEGLTETNKITQELIDNYLKLIY